MTRREGMAIRIGVKGLEAGTIMKDGLCIPTMYFALAIGSMYLLVVYDLLYWRNRPHVAAPFKFLSRKVKNSSD